MEWLKGISKQALIRKPFDRLSLSGDTGKTAVVFKSLISNEQCNLSLFFMPVIANSNLITFLPVARLAVMKAKVTRNNRVL